VVSELRRLQLFNGLSIIESTLNRRKFLPICLWGAEREVQADLFTG